MKKKAKFYPVTLKHIRKAVNDIAKGKFKHGQVIGYDQSSWCGTNCCVLGHAWAIAGNKVKRSTAGTERFRSVKRFLYNKYPVLYSLLRDPDTTIEQFQRHFN